MSTPYLLPPTHTITERSRYGMTAVRPPRTVSMMPIAPSQAQTKQQAEAAFMTEPSTIAVSTQTEPQKRKQTAESPNLPSTIPNNGLPLKDDDILQQITSKLQKWKISNICQLLQLLYLKYGINGRNKMQLIESALQPPKEPHYVTCKILEVICLREFGHQKHKDTRASLCKIIQKELPAFTGINRAAFTDRREWLDFVRHCIACQDSKSGEPNQEFPFECATFMKTTSKLLQEIKECFDNVDHVWNPVDLAIVKLKIDQTMAKGNELMKEPASFHQKNLGAKMEKLNEAKVAFLFITEPSSIVISTQTEPQNRKRTAERPNSPSTAVDSDTYDEQAATPRKLKRQGHRPTFNFKQESMAEVMAKVKTAQGKITHLKQFFHNRLQHIHVEPPMEDGDIQIRCTSKCTSGKKHHLILEYVKPDVTRCVAIHLSTSHSRDYECEWCRESFRTVQLFSQHLRTTLNCVRVLKAVCNDLLLDGYNGP